MPDFFYIVLVSGLEEASGSANPRQRCVVDDCKITIEAASISTIRSYCRVSIETPPQYGHGTD